MPEQSDYIDLQSAFEFAAKHRSSSLIVIRDKDVLTERYMLGWDAHGTGFIFNEMPTNKYQNE